MTDDVGKAGRARGEDAEQPRPRPAEGVTSYPLGREAVVLDARRNTGCSLNASATAIWLLCDGSRSMLDISRDLASDIECDAADLMADVEGVVDELHRLEFVTLS